MSGSHDVRAMFSHIAPTYDLVNCVLSLGRHNVWRRRFAGEVLRGLGPAPLVLDVCGGTGDIALACVERRRHCRAVVVDFSTPMLELCRAKAKRSGAAERIALVGGDALRLPVADGSCDAVTCAWGVRNLVNLEAGVQEMARCLRPGGRLGIMEFFKPGQSLLHRVVSWYVRRVIPLAGGLIARNRRAYAYLPDSISRFVTREEFADLLLSCGFTGMRSRELTLGVATMFLATKSTR